MTGIPSQFNSLGNALRFAEQGHRVISQNIANVNTPGYKTQELPFEQLKELLEAGETASPATWQPVIRAGLDERFDGNNVDLDQQFSELKKNAMLFQTFSQLLASQMDTMKRAMSR